MAACSGEQGFLCERIPWLDGAGKARAEECRTMADCKAFASCLKDLT